MRPRHWDQLSTQIGINVHPEKNFNLTKAADMGLLNHLEGITKVRFKT
jgi:hypothetical protein